MKTTKGTKKDLGTGTTHGKALENFSIFKSIFHVLDVSKQWLSLGLSIAAIIGAVYVYFSGFYTENVELKKQLILAETKYQKSIVKAKLDYEAKLRAVQAQHIKQLREEDREHDKELREVYNLLGKAQNKTDRVKIERDLFAFALGIEKGSSRQVDPLEKLNKLRDENLDKIKDSIEKHKKIRATKRAENEKLKELLKEIETRDLELDAEFDEKIPTSN